MIRITITRRGIAAVGKTVFRDAGRAAIYAAALYWWQKYLPLHFQNIAYLRYRFAPRDKRTNKYKAARKPWPFGEHTAPASGEVLPLVFTGESRRRALSQPNIKAVAPNYETYHADVVIDAPAFNFAAGKRIDMRDEVTRITPHENATLERIFGEEWDKQLTSRGLSATTTKIAA